MSETDETSTEPIEDLATLRTRLAEAHQTDPATAAIGGFVLTMLFALPLGIWLGTDAGAIGGVLAGMGWLLLLVIGLFIVSSIVGGDKPHRSAGLTLLVGGPLAGLGWFLYYGDSGWVMPALLAAAGPFGGLLGWRAEARKMAALKLDPPLGLTAETVAACAALPEALAEPIGPLLDRAVADVSAIDRLVDNGMLEASGQSVVALQGDVDRAMRTLARRALVADTMCRRKDDNDAEPVLEGMQRIGDELHNLADAALVAAASAEGTADSLGEHINNLRLTTAGQTEIARAVAGS